MWYWRYWEAPPWVYDKLPSLVEKPNRQRKPKKAKAEKDQSEQRKLEAPMPTVADAEEK